MLLTQLLTQLRVDISEADGGAGRRHVARAQDAHKRDLAEATIDNLARRLSP